MKAKALPSRADEVRRIAQGIFDGKDRRVVLRLLADYEKISKKER